MTEAPLAKPNEKDASEPVRPHFVVNLRSILYGIIFFLIFGLTVAELGLVSEQLHKYGDSYENYASMEYKHALGILLFAVLASLLAVLSHPWTSVGFIAVCSFILAIFFGTGAGIVNRTAPFKGTSCGRPADSYPENWQPYAHECSRIVSIQAVAWSLWGAYIFMLVGTLIHKLKIKIRSTPEEFYFNKP